MGINFRHVLRFSRFGYIIAGSWMRVIIGKGMAILNQLPTAHNKFHYNLVWVTFLTIFAGYFTWKSRRSSKNSRARPRSYRIHHAALGLYFLWNYLTWIFFGGEFGAIGTHGYLVTTWILDTVTSISGLAPALLPKARKTNHRYRKQECITLKALFASCVISVTFRFWPVLNFFMPFFIMPLAFFNAYKHPLVFFVNASAKQCLSSQESLHFKQTNKISIDNLTHNNFVKQNRKQAF